MRRYYIEAKTDDGEDAGLFVDAESEKEAQVYEEVILQHLLLSAGLLALYAFACAWPMLASCVAVVVYALFWKKFLDDEPWWIMKSALLVATMAVAGPASALPEAIYPCINALLLVNMAVTIRLPPTPAEAQVHALGFGLMTYLAVFGWHAGTGAGPVPSPLPWWWIVTYTLWNALFIWTRFPQSLSRAILVLALPIAVSVWRGPSAWLYARGSMLALGLVISTALRESRT